MRLRHDEGQSERSDVLYSLVVSFLVGITPVLWKPKVSACRSAWIAALLSLSSIPSGTHAQESSKSPVSEPAPSPERDEALPQITITGRKLRQAVNNFVFKAMGHDLVRSEEHPVARWRQPICLLVGGLTHPKGQLLFDRLVYVWSSLSIPLDKPGCRANFFVIVSEHPEADLKDLWSQVPQMFGGARGGKSFIDTPRPVRIWYNSKLTDAYNSDGGVYLGTPTIVPTYRAPQLPDLVFSAVPNISSVIVVVDFSRVVGLDLRQLADYIAIAGLTELQPDADVGEVPSILRLFTTSGDARPQSLTTWDKALVKELSAIDAVSRGQRAQIANGMYRDLAAH
jgi:hypothetical protein